MENHAATHGRKKGEIGTLRFYYVFSTFFLLNYGCMDLFLNYVFFSLRKYVFSVNMSGDILVYIGVKETQECLEYLEMIFKVIVRFLQM